MTQAGNDTQKEFMLKLKAEIESTLAAYSEVSELRRKTLEQDIEQTKVYYGVIESQPEAKLNPLMAKRISRLISKKPKKMTDNHSCRDKQDELEKRFLKLQEALVGLISKQFKYR
jgi:hypothetical protein